MHRTLCPGRWTKGRGGKFSVDTNTGKVSDGIDRETGEFTPDRA